MINKNYRLDEDGEPEKRCSKCGEWWPADNEFFPKRDGSRGGLYSWCKACCLERAKIKPRPHLRLTSPWEAFV